MARKPKKRTKTAEVAFTGEEPQFTGRVSREEMMRALNWYNYFYSIKDSRKWILEFMKQKGYSQAQIDTYKGSNSSRITQTRASQARMLSRGAQFVNDLEAHILDVLNEETAQNGVSERGAVKTTSKDTFNTLIADLDEILDQFYRSNYRTLQDVAGVVQNRSASEYKEAKEHYAALSLEVAEGVGYERLTKRQLNKYLQQLEAIHSALQLTATTTKRRVARKPRKRKEKPVEQLVSKMKYAQDSAEFGVASINPTKILDSTELWVFDTKYRKLIKYVAQEGTKLSVKGTTIQNFDEKKSYYKRLRKPAEVLPKVMAEGKRAVDKMVEGLSTKKVPTNGRTSDCSVLLRNFK